MKSMGKQTFSIPEIDDLCKVNVDIELSLLSDRFDSIMEGISFSSKKLDGLPSAAIDKYIARRESVVTKWEEMMGQAEAAQARIKELLDSLQTA